MFRQGNEPGRPRWEASILEKSHSDSLSCNLEPEPLQKLINLIERLIVRAESTFFADSE
jgi:hypothetical protein